MTPEIAFLFAILGGMVYLFLTEKLPVDLTAFLGLVILTLSGYLSPSEAFTGFSSPAVITMLSVFIVGAALLEKLNEENLVDIWAGLPGKCLNLFLSHVRNKER